MSPDRCRTCRGPNLDQMLLAVGEKCDDCGRVRSTPVSCPRCARLAAAGIEVYDTGCVALTCVCGECFDSEIGAAEQTRPPGWADRKRVAARASVFLVFAAFRGLDAAIDSVERGVTGGDPWQRIHAAQRDGRDVIDAFGEEIRPRDQHGQAFEEIAALEDKETIAALRREIGNWRRLLSESNARNHNAYDRGFAFAKLQFETPEPQPDPKLNCPKCGGDKWAGFEGPGDASTVEITCLCGYSFQVDG